MKTIEQKLAKKASEYAYIWLDSETFSNIKNKKASLGELYFDELKKYLINFDFTSVKKSYPHSFDWFNYVEDEFISVWTAANFETKLVIFLMAVSLANLDEQVDEYGEDYEVWVENTDDEGLSN